MFATPTYHGARFDQHVLPLDVLPDLAAYRELVVELAKQLYLRSAPRRRRVPKGFADSLQLGLGRVEDGSAAAVIQRLDPRASMFNEAFHSTDVFAQARDLVGAVLEAAANDSPLPSEFPMELLQSFNRIGRTLRQDEFIEFRSGRDAVGPKYSREIRRNLILLGEEQYEDETVIRGTINGAVVDRDQVVIRTEEGLVDVNVRKELVRQALTWVNRPVRVPAIVLRNRDDKLVRVLEVHEFALVEFEAATPLSTQFAEILELRDGWLDGQGKGMAAEELSLFLPVLSEAVEKHGLPVPFLYPTEEGNVRAEWSFPGWEVSATCEADTAMVDIHAVDVNGPDTSSSEIAIERKDAAYRIARAVGQYLPDQEEML